MIGLNVVFYQAAVIPALFSGRDGVLSIGEVVTTTFYPPIDMGVLARLVRFDSERAVPVDSVFVPPGG